MKVIASILFLLFFPTYSMAQEQNHTHARNEIGISPGATYSPSHQSWGFGCHVHYFHTLGEHSPWAVGGSLERIFTHGSHWTIGAGIKYRVLDRLNIAVMPGITFPGHDEEHDHADEADHHNNNPKFSAHFEVVYDLIHLKHFHFGPAVDYSWSKNDSHLSLGIHCAYAF